MSGAYSFEEAAKDAQLRGSGNHNMKRISEFRKWLADQDLDVELDATSKDDLKMIKFEFEKIQTRITKLLKKISPGQ